MVSMAFILASSAGSKQGSTIHGIIRQTLPADHSVLNESDGIMRALLCCFLDFLPEVLVVPDVIRSD